MISLRGLGQSLIFQVAKKASVLKRRKSKNRMEVPGTPLGDAPSPAPPPSAKSDSEAEVVFYMDEPKAGETFLTVLWVCL